MPQNLSDNQKEDLQKWGEDGSYLLKNYLHTLGNLTLVDENTKLSNNPFKEKRG